MENINQNQAESFEQNNLPNKPLPENIAPPIYAKKKSKIVIILGLLFLIILAFIVTGTFAYVYKIGPFAQVAPYTEKNLFSGVLGSLANIKSSSYNASVLFSMEKRDLGALPFTTKLSNETEVKKQYENDSNRAKDIDSIISALKYQSKSFPATLQAILNSKNNYYKDISIKDPKTNQTYNYVLTESGKNFSLSVTFETNAAISAIKKYDTYSNKKVITATTYNDKTVTFTKDSYSYFYVSSTPPKPALVSLSDSLSYLPPEMKVSGAVSMQADWVNKSASEWRLNVSADGDFGDLTYKANIDGLRKDKIYYFKINNLPSLFFTYFALEKNQWFKIDTSKQVSGNLSSYFSSLPEDEKYFKENQAKFYDLMKKMIKIADEQGLIAFKNPAVVEKIDGQNLFRYDLQMRKEAILPFYKALQAEVAKTDLTNKYPVTLDQGYIEYLQSPEFNEAFDYYQNNTNLSIWVDSKGFPIIASYDIRVVPQDSAVQLKDKQGKLIFKLQASEINQPVNITAPADAKDIQDVMKGNPK